MAVLGSEGRMTLLREAPDPLLFAPASLNPADRSLSAGPHGFWSGDQITLYNPGGLPTDWNPEGTAQYADGDKWVVGPSRNHIIDDSTAFYRSDDSAFFYEQDTPQTIVQRTLFVHVDQLGRVSFYESQRDAMFGSVNRRLEIEQFDWGVTLLYQTGSCDYQTDVIHTFRAHDSATCGLQMVADAVMPCPSDSKPVWEFVCGLRSWSLDMDASSLDTTAIGVKFGEGVKSLVTATGTLDFLVDRTAEDWDGQALLRLVLMTERGCKARAEFWMYQDRVGDVCLGQLSGDFYYQADILMVRSAVSLRYDDVVAGTVNYATTGEVKLLVGSA